MSRGGVMGAAEVFVVPAGAAGGDAVVEGGSVIAGTMAGAGALVGGVVGGAFVAARVVGSVSTSRASARASAVEFLRLVFIVWRRG